MIWWPSLWTTQPNLGGDRCSEGKMAQKPGPAPSSCSEEADGPAGLRLESGHGEKMADLRRAGSSPTVLPQEPLVVFQCQFWCTMSIAAFENRGGVAPSSLFLPPVRWVLLDFLSGSRVDAVGQWPRVLMLPHCLIASWMNSSAFRRCLTFFSRYTN